MTERPTNSPESYADRWVGNIRRDVKLVGACVHPTDQARVYSWVVIYQFVNDLTNPLFLASLLYQRGKQNESQQSIYRFWLTFSQATSEFGALLPAETQNGIQTFIDLHHHQIKGLIDGEAQYRDQAPAIVREISADLGNFQQLCGISDQEMESSNDVYCEILHLLTVADEATGHQLPEAALREKFMTVFRQGREYLDWRILPQKKFSPPDLSRVPVWVSPEYARILTNFLTSVPLTDKFSGDIGFTSHGRRVRTFEKWLDNLPDADASRIAGAIYKQNPLRGNSLNGAIGAMRLCGEGCQNNDRPEAARSILDKIPAHPRSPHYQEMAIKQKIQFVQEVKQAVAETLHTLEVC